MKRYNLIFLRTGEIRLSRKQYTDWQEIQDEYKDYMTSIDFESLKDIETYIKIDYKLTSNKAQYEIKRLTDSSDDTVQLEI